MHVKLQFWMNRLLYLFRAPKTLSLCCFELHGPRVGAESRLYCLFLCAVWHDAPQIPRYFASGSGCCRWWISAKRVGRTCLPGSYSRINTRARACWIISASPEKCTVVLVQPPSLHDCDCNCVWMAVIQWTENPDSAASIGQIVMTQKGGMLASPQSQSFTSSLCGVRMQNWFTQHCFLCVLKYGNLFLFINSF